MCWKGILAGLYMTALSGLQFAEAGLIEGKAYLNDPQNSQYWSLLQMNLDIARLSWSDNLGLSSQASVADVNAFISSNNDGWRWATALEFTAIHQWFDTDELADGWSEAQKAGSALFFLLNGIGPAFNTQHGYDFEGYTYWQLGILSDSAMQYVWMADFAWQIPDVSCASYSLLCSSGYFTDVSSPLWLADNILQMGELNVAPLLVRERPVLIPAVVPVGSTGWLMLFGIAAILRRRHA